MMKKILMVLALCFLASSVLAGPAYTNQKWTFSTEDGPQGMAPDNPEGNPFGLSIASINTPPNWSVQWDTEGFWEGDGFNIIVDIENNPIPNAYKIIEVSAVFRGDLSLSWILDDSDSHFDRISRSISPIEGTDWLLLEDEWYIAPNPSSEKLCFGFAGIDGQQAALASFEVSTWCIPEPATMALLGLGGMALLRRRK